MVQVFVIMIKAFSVTGMMLLTFSMLGQALSPYQLFNSNGRKVSYSKLLKSSLSKDLVLFGEEHNNAISHWLQLRLTKDCFRSKPLVLGAEMFERDNQDELDAYLSGSIDAAQLDSTARLWPNYGTDYAPLVDFAKSNHLPFIATNIPRRFASQVAKRGLESLDSLTDEEKSWIAPLPIAYDVELPGYKNMLSMMGGHGGPNLPKAQAIKDATMAHFILTNMKSNALFIHYQGSYHSENHEGIIWYLKHDHPDIKYVSIATVTQDQIKTLDKVHKGKADFIICVDEDMTRTY